MIHQFAIRPTGGGGGGATASLKISAGTLSALRTDVTFSNSNGVSFGLNAAGVVTATVQTNYLTTAMASNRGSDFVQATAAFAGTNASGTINSTGISVSVAAQSAQSINISAGTTSNNLTAVTFSNSNNVSFGLNASTLTASIATTYAGTGFTTATTAGTNVVGTLNTSGLSLGVPAYLTTAALSQDSSKYAGTAFATTTSAGTAIAGTLNTSGLTLGVPAFLTTAMQSNAATISNINISAGTTSTNASAFTFSNSNNVSFGLGTGASAGVVTASIATTYAGTGFTSTTTAGTAIVGTLNTSGLSLGVPAFLTTAALSSQTLAFTLGGNSATTNSSQILNGGYILAGGANVTIQQSNNTISISAASAAGAVTGSYWGNCPYLQSAPIAALSSSGSSVLVQPFFLPYAISASYVRMIGSFIDNSQSTAGTTQANTTFSCKAFSTVALVLYSQGVGASSRSIQSIASSSAGFTMATIFSAGNTGSQYTITLQKTYPVSGFTTSSYSTSYAVSSGSIVISSASNTLFTGLRFLDIPWATSHDQGNYWFGIGASTSSASNSSNISFCGTLTMQMPLCMNTQINSAFGALGVATSVSDNQLQIAQGAWSTNSSIISTASIGVNSVAQNSAVSQQMLPFWFVRQA